MTPCLPQIQGAQIQPAAETAPAMLMALETGAVDFICTDMPTAKGAVAAYPDMKLLGLHRLRRQLPKWMSAPRTSTSACL